jgi:hypothetical protein
LTSLGNQIYLYIFVVASGGVVRTTGDRKSFRCLLCQRLRISELTDKNRFGNFVKISSLISLKALQKKKTKAFRLLFCRAVSHFGLIYTMEHTNFPWQKGNT